MKRILVWDIPVRLFHWILAGSFLIAFLISNTADDESPVFAVHMLLGGIAAFMVMLRLVWGFVGTRWARFNSFSGREIFSYLRGAFFGGEKRYTGHNPGSSIAAVLMFVFIIGLAVTGIMMGRGNEDIKEVHELFSWGMIATVVAHLAGIAYYTVRHREFIASSMVTGRKQGDPAGAIPTARPIVGLAFLVITALWTLGLVNGYDSTTGQARIPLTGQTLQLGKGGEGEGGEYEREEHDGEDRDRSDSHRHEREEHHDRDSREHHG